MQTRANWEKINESTCYPISSHLLVNLHAMHTRKHQQRQEGKGSRNG
ncbi:MAG: hypothetical protein ACKO96_03645 [Flammeovirgaceae bacterium]